jgi:hypothetical protein
MTRLNTPHDPNKKPAPKLHATEVPLPKAGEKEQLHDEKIVDEALDESFPASDPPVIAHPGSSLAVKKIAKDGRDTPAAEPDPACNNIQPEPKEKKPNDKP